MARDMIVVSVFLTLGRWFVIDFGLAGLFDRFEQTFGSFLTKLLTILIGMAIAAACLSMIGQFVAPLVMWAIGTNEPSPTAIAQGVEFAVNILALVVLSAMVSGYIEGKVKVKRGLDNIDDVYGQSMENLRRIMNLENNDEAMKVMKTLSDAVKAGKLDDFIKEHEADPDGDLDKLDEVIKRPTQGSGKATRPASSQDASDD